MCLYSCGLQPERLQPERRTTPYCIRSAARLRGIVFGHVISSTRRSLILRALPHVLFLCAYVTSRIIFNCRVRHGYWSMIRYLKLEIVMKRLKGLYEQVSAGLQVFARVIPDLVIEWRWCYASIDRLINEDNEQRQKELANAWRLNKLADLQRVAIIVGSSGYLTTLSRL